MTHGPIVAADRIDTLDVLRGVAICGILLMNIPAMGMIGLAGRPVHPFRWDADWTAWTVQSLLFEGTMRGLFTLLFGAGMLLMLRRAEGAAPEVTPFDVWTRRCLALMALGVMQWAVFFWPGEILWTYGLVGLALLAFRTARPRTLLLIAAIVIAVLSVLRFGEASGRVDMSREAAVALRAQAAGATLTDEQEKVLDGRAKVRTMMGLEPAARIEEYRQRTTLSGVYAWSRDNWVPWNLGTDAWPWLAETLAFMLIGMALYRTGVLTGAASPGTYRLLILGGYGVGLTLRLVAWVLGLRTGQLIDPDNFDAAALLWHSAPYQIARLAITLGHVGVIVAVYRSGALGRAWPIRAMGRMALTVYTLESVLTSILFYGLGMLGAFGFAGLMAISAAIWIGCGLFCVWWLRGHDMGPAEMVLRALAYGGLRRRRAEAAATLATAPSV